MTPTRPRPSFREDHRHDPRRRFDLECLPGWPARPGAAAGGRVGPLRRPAARRGAPRPGPPPRPRGRPAPRGPAGRDVPGDAAGPSPGPARHGEGDHRVGSGPRAALAAIAAGVLAILPSPGSSTIGRGPAGDRGLPPWRIPVARAEDPAARPRVRWPPFSLHPAREGTPPPLGAGERRPAPADRAGDGPAAPASWCTSASTWTTRSSAGSSWSPT